MVLIFISQTMESGTIAAWKVSEGDPFVAGDVFCSVETDKATVDFEAQDDGVVGKILVPAGPKEIKCGDPILITVNQEADVSAFVSYTLPSAATSTLTDGPPQSSAPATTTPLPASAATTKLGTVAPVSTHSVGRVVASPLAYMLAKEGGLDISAIVGTGPGGRIIASDVKDFPSTYVLELDAPTTKSVGLATQVASTAVPVMGTGYTDFPLSESAREIAARLTLSKQRVPHYYLTVDICMDKMVDLRLTLNSGSGEGPQIGVYELLLKAAAVSMKTVPYVNASWMDSVVRVYDSVDINIVVGSGDALYTPVIRDCGSLGVKSISDAVSRAMKVLEHSENVANELSALGTFTVINLGMYGIKSCAPIIREPQSCALALGALENRVAPSDDEHSHDIYKQCLMMTVTLSCDHRVVDGAVGAQWLSAFKAHVEHPTTLLL
jgi:pyruvate dehydrogenase E2 component (dihydrolipoamide acetyltransferase)